MGRRFAPRVFGTSGARRRCLPSGRDRAPGAGRNERRHHGPGRLPDGAVVPGRDARTAKRPALCSTVRAAGARRVLDGDGKWPDCADEVPYDFRAECACAHHISKENCAPSPAGRAAIRFGYRGRSIALRRRDAVVRSGAAGLHFRVAWFAAQPDSPVAGRLRPTTVGPLQGEEPL